MELAGYRSEVWPALQLPVPQRRGPFTLRAIGRLKPGVSLDVARADLKAISTRLFDAWSSGFESREATPAPYSMRQRMLRNASKTLWLFAGAVGLVLLIAVANVASLMLVRATARSREAALRTMLGASRTRLARLLVTESLVLSALGTVLGIALAWGLLKALRIFGASIPRISEATLRSARRGVCGVAYGAHGPAHRAVPGHLGCQKAAASIARRRRPRGRRDTRERNYYAVHLSPPSSRWRCHC